MATYLWISLGAILGANARFLVARYAAKFLGSGFPYGTFIVNVVGSLILGWFMVWSTERAVSDPRLRLFVAVGFCGGYTTFSSYAYESFVQLEQGHWGLFATNILGNNVIGMLAVIAGAMLARGM